MAIISPNGISGITSITTVGNNLSLFNSNGSTLTVLNTNVNSTGVSTFSGNVSLSLGSASAPSVYFGSDTNTGIYSPGADSLAISTGGSQRATVDSSGRLLVGTSSSVSNLYRANTASIAPTLQIENVTNSYSTGFSSLNYSASGFAPVVTLGLSKSNTQGTNTVVASGDELGYLQFVGADGTNFRTAAWIRGEVDGTPGANDMPGRLVFSTTADGASSPTERMRITSGSANGANFLFNCTDTPSSTVKGSGIFPNSAFGNYYVTATSTTSNYIHVQFTNPNGAVGSINTNGSATAYNTSSDYRLKENITPVADGITRLQQLKPSRFNFIADPDKTVDGFLAHEAAEVVPECVTGEKDAVDDDGNPIYQGIDQSKLVPLLTAALQEAIGEIESLKARVAALESA